MGVHYPFSPRVQLMVAPQLVALLRALDADDYQRFLDAQRFAEQTVVPLLDASQSSPHLATVFNGIALEVKFCRKSERFYISDFQDFGEDPTPPPSGTPVGKPRTRTNAELLLISAGIDPLEITLADINITPDKISYGMPGELFIGEFEPELFGSLSISLDLTDNYLPLTSLLVNTAGEVSLSDALRQSPQFISWTSAASQAAACRLGSCECVNAGALGHQHASAPDQLVAPGPADT